MANRKNEIVRNQPKRRVKVIRSKVKTTKTRAQLPQLSLAEQVEAERFKVFTQHRAAQQARVRALIETSESNLGLP